MTSCKHWSSTRGCVTVNVAVLMAVLVSFAALTIDVGYGLVARNQLYNTVDAAVLAGARQLGRIYENTPWQNQQGYVLTSSDRAAIEQVMNHVASQNYTAGVAITLLSSDIHIGTWDFTSGKFTETNTHPTAVKATARRDTQANGPISTFLGGIMGIKSVNVLATATAALSGISHALPGELDAPVTISAYWFSQNQTMCGQQIKFNPTGSLAGCSAWTTYDQPANNNTLKTILDGLTHNTYQSPDTIAGQTLFNFTGGNLGNQTFTAFQNLYNARKDPVTGQWKTFVAVRDQNDCSNPSPSKPELIVGFATAVITQVLPPPSSTIQATVYCNLVETGRGGGSNYGTLASIPGLVQ